LDHLPKSDELLRLDISGTRVDDSGLTTLANRSPRLRYLWLRGAPVTDRGLEAVSRLHELHELDLAQTAVSNCGLMYLRSLKQLSMIDLSGTTVTVKGIQELRGLPLWELRLSNTNGVGSSWSIFPDLRWLYISNSDINDKDLRGLGKLSHLEKLVVRGTKITEIGIREIGKVDTLLMLDLAQCNISNQLLWSLADLPRLSSLSLRGTGVTDGVHEPLSRFRNLEVLDLRDTQLTSRGFRELAKIDTLQELYISGPDAAAAIEQLRDALPHCRIYKARPEQE
jgi:Leucine-rich repeat (LRR) protein